MAVEIKHAETLDDLKAEFTSAGDKLVVVDFYASWCGPCKQIAPKFQEMSQEFKDVVFLKVNVDEAEDILSEYEVSAMPTFIFFKSGSKVYEFKGANAAELRKQLEALK